MYQPAHGRFVVSNPTGLLSELAAVAPATLVTVDAGGFRASVLPMLFDPAVGPRGALCGHLARANEQVDKRWANGGAIAIFIGPEAYVSPTWYAEKGRAKVVPTWNYTAVVAHGTLVVHEEPDWLLAHLQLLVDAHESKFPEPWSLDGSTQAYVEKQLHAIVGLELRLTLIEAKRKLSQNRSVADIEGVIEALSGGSESAQAVAAEMRRERGRQ
jgi:transcriptional regulator